MKIHLRDPDISRPVSLCFELRATRSHLTDDPARVTCGRCLRMMERRKKWEPELTAVCHRLPGASDEEVAEDVNRFKPVDR